MYKVMLTGKTLMVQTRDELRLEEFHSPYALQKRVDELKQRGQISQQKYHHLTEQITRRTELNLRKS